VSADDGATAIIDRPTPAAAIARRITFAFCSASAGRQGWRLNYAQTSVSLGLRELRDPSGVAKRRLRARAKPLGDATSAPRARPHDTTRTRTRRQGRRRSQCRFRMDSSAAGSCGLAAGRAVVDSDLGSPCRSFCVRRCACRRPPRRRWPVRTVNARPTGAVMFPWTAVGAG
jgi:hypothetical protein